MKYLVTLSICFVLTIYAPDVFSGENPNKNSLIVTVNGRKITQEDVARRMESYKNLNIETLDTVRNEIVDQLITDTLLEDFIDKQGLVVSQDEIESEVSKVRKNIAGSGEMNAQSLEKILIAVGSNLDEFKKSVKHSIALEKHFRNKLDDKTLEIFFEENKNLFNDESVRVSHILTDTNGMKTQEELSQALKQIKDVKIELNQGAPFEEMAKKYSHCPSAIRGGDLGYIQRKGSFAKQFLDAAFFLKEGEVSEPVQTEYGYHLIKVTDKKEGVKVSFKEVKERVRQEALDSSILGLLDSLKKDAQIVVNK